ncbi:MAG: exodeoxyribonuclease VII small subunit [Nevskiales bacterium]
MSEKKSRVNEFEKSLAELEALVERMESGELSLEDSMKQFERGIQLARACQQQLKQAELKVQQLVQKNGDAKLEDFADDSGNE